MISMPEYEEIIKLRNKGFTQEEIAVLVGISLRTVSRYLASGKIPVYKRVKPTKTDPFEKYKARAEEIIKNGINGKPPRAVDLFRTLVKEGYSGSLRTVQRKTCEHRKAARGREIYFEQEVDYGEMVEGDFTDIEVLFVSGKEKRHLWTMSSKKVKSCHASSFNNLTFESFAEGTANGFTHFGGVSRVYRLDNLKPVVKRILKNGRNITDKFNQLKNHYNFIASFCTPGKGNEKGTIESTNKHFKLYLSYEMEVEKKIFSNDADFGNYLSLKLEEYNKPKMDEAKKERDFFAQLPPRPFPAFSTEISEVNKYGFVRVSERRYSVPEEYKYRRVEIRKYSNRIEIFLNGKKIKEHSRQTNSGHRSPILDFRDHVKAMLRKPGAFTYYKHKEFFFPTEIFRELYDRNPDNKNYLRCLALCKNHSIAEVELAIRMVLDLVETPCYESILNLIEPRKEEENVFIAIQPLKPVLDPYDFLLSRNNSKGDVEWKQHWNLI